MTTQLRKLWRNHIKSANSQLVGVRKTNLASAHENIKKKLLKCQLKLKKKKNQKNFLLKKIPFST
jgi:hypothetical protein